MGSYRKGDDREQLLADVAEMYYEDGLTQDQIARIVSVTRSMISRMLTEARQKGIIEIKIHAPLRYNTELETTLVDRFGLESAHVLSWNRENRSDWYDELRDRLGSAAAQALKERLASNMVLGVSWGTTVSATIDALEISQDLPVKVVQLVGVLGSDSQAFNAQELVENLARKLGGDGVYLYTPFIVDNEVTARSLLNLPNVHQAVELGKKCDMALLGIGSTDPEFCSLYQGGYISRENLQALQRAGAVGDVSGHYFDILGRAPGTDLDNRLVGIAREDLLSIPIRLGVAGGRAKAPAILGALRGRYVNELVTDSNTASLVLELAKQQK